MREAKIYTPANFRAIAESLLNTFGEYESNDALRAHPGWKAWCEGWAGALGMNGVPAVDMMVTAYLSPDSRYVDFE